MVEVLVDAEEFLEKLRQVCAGNEDSSSVFGKLEDVAIASEFAALTFVEL